MIRYGIGFIEQALDDEHPGFPKYSYREPAIQGSSTEKQEDASLKFRLALQSLLAASTP